MKNNYYFFGRLFKTEVSLSKKLPAIILHFMDTLTVSAPPVNLHGIQSRVFSCILNSILRKTKHMGNLVRVSINIPKITNLSKTF